MATSWWYTNQCSPGGPPRPKQRSMMPVEFDSVLDLHDRILDETQGLRPMPALVPVGGFELALRRPQRAERRTHVRLIRLRRGGRADQRGGRAHQRDPGQNLSS